MKTNLIQSCLLAAMLLALPAVVQAQFNITTNNGTITITRYTGYSGAVSIPATINGLPVTSIGNGAFSQCTSLSSVSIPNSVTSIGDGAFDFCTSLTSVTIPNSVTSIGNGAFHYCYSLTTVTIGSGVITIGGLAFSLCTSLTAITVDALNPAYSSVSGVLFDKAQTTLIQYLDPKAGSYTIPNSVTSIGTNAFISCYSLTSVYFNGNAPSPSNDSSVFQGDNNATVYYLPGTTGWGATFDGRPTALWNPQAQTSDSSFGVRTNRFGFAITGTSGLVIVVEASTNLANPTWFPVGTNTLTGGSSYFSDPQWTNYPVRFYRLRSP